MAQLTARNLQLAYERRVVVDDLDLTLPEGKVTMIVGANGSGKSTLLRGLSRLLPPRQGAAPAGRRAGPAFRRRAAQTS